MGLKHEYHKFNINDFINYIYYKMRIDILKQNQKNRRYNGNPN